MGQPAYGSGSPEPQPHPRGVAVLVLGIIGVVICAPCGIVALILGTNAIREIDQNPSAYSNRTMINVGRILGIIAIVIWVLAIIGKFTFLKQN